MTPQSGLPTVLVLAAGRGERFVRSGGKMHKLAARLGDLPVLDHVLHSVAQAGLPCHVVHPVADACAGMGDSISRGVSETVDASGWLILPGDLPLVRPDSLLSVAQGLATAPVVVPFWQGQNGHPVGFGAECRSALMALSGDVGAATIVRTYRQKNRVMVQTLDDPGIVMDIDTLDDLAEAEAMLAVSRKK